MRSPPRQYRYGPVIEKIFFSHYEDGVNNFYFHRSEIRMASAELGIEIPVANYGDLLYYFRFRGQLPERVRATTTPDRPWVIRLAGTGRYRFQATALANILPSPGRAQTKVPDATPGVVAMYRLNDEQALLAKLRYNRLIDIFTGVTRYSLQNHLRTQVPDMGQTETDEIYVGVDRRGVHHVFPVQAKGGREKLGIVQVEQDYALCRYRFPSLVCRPIAAQFMSDDVIVLFDFEEQNDELVVASERYYRLVPAEQLTTEDLDLYQRRLETD